MLTLDVVYAKGLILYLLQCLLPRLHGGELARSGGEHHIAILGLQLPIFLGLEVRYLFISLDDKRERGRLDAAY